MRCQCGSEIKISGGRCEDCFADGQIRQFDDDCEPIGRAKYDGGLAFAFDRPEPLRVLETVTGS